MTELTAAQQGLLDVMHIQGASEDTIERTSRGMQEANRRAGLRDPEAQRLAWSFLPERAPRSWQMVSKSADGCLLDNRRTGRRVILSVARELDREVWLHASMSRRDRSLPTYQDLKDLHRTFMADLVAYQLFVPEEEHIDISPVLHLWACLTKRITPDFSAGTGTI